MGRISASHAAGLDLIDKLFFNQILVQCLFTEELLWLKELDTDLDRELTRKGVTGVQRQVAKHAVLCMMEAELSDSVFQLKEVFPDKLPSLPEGITISQCEQLQRHNLDNFEAMVLAVLQKIHQCDTVVVTEITNSLLDKYKKAPATFRYHLVERMFSHEFINAPIDCFTWLAKMEVLSSKKFAGCRLDARYSPEFLQRLALLCDFDIQRDFNQRLTYRNKNIDWTVFNGINNLSNKTRRLLFAQVLKAMEVNDSPDLKNSFPFVIFTELEKSENILKFFSSINAYAPRVRTFQGSLAGWVGMLCGGYVEVLDQDPDKKKPVYSSNSNEDSLTELVRKGMGYRGFGLNARTIYERHRDFKETILQIVTMYYNMTLAANVAIPPYMNDLVYHGLILQVGQLKPEPRRNPRPKK